ncbi:sugar ABC transporter permease [Oleiharenicola lentus]|jgi:multiple sugar transport system permease protein|uniref:Sugar ABC transporter permease n=1 Tax=Oleiharenicola lentus TaxID=2508720 RepID=A0A4Q1CBK4_9BACT|nr:sugar ABC transporter permease [Oleiharenicola lentus]RXK56360.1 sugar ABC transporter permease [Oleiharenicola lentus]
MTQSRRQLRAGLGYTALWVVGLGVFTAYPVLASVYYSFCDYSVLTSPVWIGTENYQRLWHDDLFWRALRNTLYFAVFSVPLGAIVSLSLALLLNQDVRGRPFFRALFYLPSIVPAVASSMLWLWIFNGQYGLLNFVLTPILGVVGLQPPIWLADPNWAKPALVMMSLWGVGNSMIIYLAGLQDVPKELYESAEIDGAGPWRKFWHITLPCISPVIYFNVLMGTIGALQVFTQAFIMSGGTDDGSPARSTLFYALYLFGQAFYQLRMGYASAMAWILFVIIVSLTWLATKLSARHVHYNR